MQARKRTARTALQLRVVELSSVTITWPFTAHTTCFFFRTPRSAPHFTTQPRVQPNTERMQWGQRGDQATENARYATPRSGWKNALDCQGTNVVRVWGSPWDVERAPRKLGWWGAKRVDESGRCDSRCRLSTSHSSHIYIPKFSSL